MKRSNPHRLDKQGVFEKTLAKLNVLALVVFVVLVFMKFSGIALSWAVVFVPLFFILIQIVGVIVVVVLVAFVQAQADSKM